MEETLALILTDEFLDANPEFTSAMDDKLLERATNRILAGIEKQREKRKQQQ